MEMEIEIRNENFGKDDSMKNEAKRHTHREIERERERTKMMRNIKAACKIQKKRNVEIKPTTMSSECVCAQRK